jgi:ornithine decarboxylase
VLYQGTKVELPLDLAEGDVVRLRGTGAYTSCYSTVGFNGFPPLPTQVVA